MNNLRNRVTLIGRLGKDPETTEFATGKSVTRFSLATSDNYTNAEGKKIENTQWHSVAMFGKSGEIAQKYLVKGREVAVEGKLEYQSFEDKEGVSRNKTEVIANDLVMLGGKKPD
ncbi:MAG: single-strand DNA-binding protein [Flavobacteriales bacterium]|jgi:single-strand DNA-binding protein